MCQRQRSLNYSILLTSEARPTGTVIRILHIVVSCVISSIIRPPHGYSIKSVCVLKYC
jgi:hypothetical protein